MIERRFLDWSGPALPGLVRALVDGEARDGALDLDGHLFVLPGARPGRRLTELLVEAAEAEDLRLTPPRAVTVGALPELLYRPGRPLASPALARRLWAEALRTAPRRRLAALVPEPPEPDDLAGWSGLAGIVGELHRAVTAEGLDFRRVADACGRGLPFDDSGRWRLLARVRDGYLERLEGLGRADRFEARMTALDQERVAVGDAGPGAIRAAHLAGVVEMPGVVRSMLERVAEGGTPVTAWIHAPGALADRFDEAGLVVPGAWEGVEIPVPDDVLAVRDGPGDQASEALRALADLDGAYAPDEITVGVPDPEVVPWLEQRFRAHGVAHRYAQGTPLERTAPFRLLEATADYLEGRRFADLAALLRHPGLDRLLDGSAALAAADRYHARHLPGRVGEAMPGWGRGPDAGDAPSSLPRLVRRLHGPDVLGPLAPRSGRSGAQRPLSGWMPEILALLGRVFGEAPLSRWDPDERILVEACGAVRDAAAALHRLPDDADPRCGAAPAIRVLLAELREAKEAVPPEPERAAVELLGWLELHLDDAPVLVVTGFNEGRVPASVAGDPFLPDGLRSALGLADDEARRARDAYLLTALLESRESLRVVAGRRSAAGDPLRPSRLLLTRRGEALARRVLRVVRGDDQAPPPLAPPGLRTPERSAFTVPPEAELRLGAPPVELSVTEFRDILRDPYRWILEKRMDLDALHDEARELDPLGFGSLAHRVLEAFALTGEVASADARAVARRLDALLDETVERRFGPGVLPAVPLQVEQLRRRLGAFARWHAARVEAGWRVAGTEVATPDGGVPFRVDGEPVHLKGRIDRIDVHRESGAVAVFDYKTGDEARSPEEAHRTRGGEWRDLQLPLYRHLLPHLEDPRGEPVVEAVEGRDVGLGYVCLPRDTEAVGESMAGWDEDTLRDAFERARDVIRELRERPAAAFDPARVKSGRWDPLAALLGRGVLSLAPQDPEDDDAGPEEDR